MSDQAGRERPPPPRRCQTAQVRVAENPVVIEIRHKHRATRRIDRDPVGRAHPCRRRQSAARRINPPRPAPDPRQAEAGTARRQARKGSANRRAGGGAKGKTKISSSIITSSDDAITGNHRKSAWPRDTGRRSPLSNLALVAHRTHIASGRLVRDPPHLRQIFRQMNRAAPSRSGEWTSESVRSSPKSSNAGSFSEFRPGSGGGL